MKVDIKIPEVGESIREAILAEWLKKDGDYVEKDEPVFVIETDKVTLEVPAVESGILEILTEEGTTVEIGAVVGKIETETVGGKPYGKKTEEKEKQPEKEETQDTKADTTETEKDKKEDTKAEKEPAGDPALPPSVRRMVAEHDIDPAQITGSGKKGQLTKQDVVAYLESIENSRDAQEAGKEAQRPALEEKTGEEVTRKPMSPIRKTIASRLLSAKQNTAMLTTFNEIDMSGVKRMRTDFKERFYEKHGVRLGFMSFFIKATTAALKEYPEVNASIDGEDMVYHHYYHIGIAIGAKRGLVVPVIRHADVLSFAQIESRIINFADRVQNNRLTMAELEGGTFSITNGGIYGSLMSTPILNPPQSAILGMHKIEDRPVAIDGQVVIRPMMYVAVSYDHRIVDGKNAVGFLKRIKEFIENPERMIMEI